MNTDIEKVLIDAQKIAARVVEIGAQISADYVNQKLLIIGILSGSVPFVADLMRNIIGDVEIDFMAMSSYEDGTESSGRVKIVKDLNVDIKDRNVLVAEDIIDSGRTIARLREMLLVRGPKDLKICSFLDKPKRRVVDISADYIGFEIPDEFVVGYGLDYAQKYRNLPFVGVLKRSVYE